MKPTVIQFKLSDGTRTAKASATLEGQNISHYIEAFKGFLLMIGFAPETIKEYFNED